MGLWTVFALVMSVGSVVAFADVELVLGEMSEVSPVDACEWCGSGMRL